MESNIDQGMEHVVLTAAQLGMALAGYSALGGCECGCGVSCEVLGYDHARWVCPGSVGYTCADPDDNIGAVLLFAEEPDQAPCSVQSEGVCWPWSKCPPWQCSSSPPVPPQRAPGQLSTPRVRPSSHWAPSHRLECSSSEVAGVTCNMLLPLAV